jgi:hypothetical protein
LELDSQRKGSVNVTDSTGGILPDSIVDSLEKLTNLSKAALCNLWEQTFKTDPSPNLRRALMIPILAFRIQEQAFGSLSSGTSGRLRHLSRAYEKDRDCSIASPAPLRPGTRLVRQWRDQVHLVNVEANGYEYQGGRYQSLSEIARLITGVRWSGPLFFGLKTQQAKNTLETK